ncbi:response regulator transcription factor [Thermaerobacillus caldiproteolyticus]|uniref:response regulator transcription factor n=1 Tax=Thermaerobacillus caldiproteolyticus TaxID=247480 RepID=UPI00188B5626|nr:response regulator transcription factor [Anoxybacillus caldiproteolyticus]QPA32852.1 response regulator transcription factor [Anoxybacillus caldiproteolyticus]
MTRIVLVDDEQRMLDLLELYLAPKGYECIKCRSGEEAMDYVRHNVCDLILLDVMMPYMDGWETCRNIRQFSDVPIIMVTARDHKLDVVKGLKIGADDYITKPFDEDELVARMEAVLRRTRKNSQLEDSGLVWNELTHEVTYNGKKIPVTPKEFGLLGLFLRNPNRVFSREQLIVSLWGYDAETEGRTVDSHIRNLREKMRQAGFPIDERLETVWGIGYKWVTSY